MDDKKKLITLLCKFSLNQEWILSVAKLADYLLENGVTFQKWEVVGDPPPTGEVLAFSQKSGGMAVGRIVVALWNDDMEVIEFACENALEPMFDVTHWMPKPKPPKEEHDGT